MFNIAPTDGYNDVSKMAVTAIVNWGVARAAAAAERSLCYRNWWAKWWRRLMRFIQLNKIHENRMSGRKINLLHFFIISVVLPDLNCQILNNFVFVFMCKHLGFEWSWYSGLCYVQYPTRPISLTCLRGVYFPFLHHTTHGNRNPLRINWTCNTSVCTTDTSWLGHVNSECF